jgi:hypothetical protein
MQMERGNNSWEMTSKGTISVDENSMLNLPSTLAKDDLILRFPKAIPSYTALLTEKSFDEGIFLKEIQQCHFIAGALFELLLTQPGAADLLKMDANILDELQELGLKISAAMQQNDSLQFLPSEEMMLLVLSSYLQEKQDSRKPTPSEPPSVSSEPIAESPVEVMDAEEKSGVPVEETAPSQESDANETRTAGGLSAIEYDATGALAETRENATILVNLPESGDAPYFSSEENEDQGPSDTENLPDLDAEPVEIHVEEAAADDSEDTKQDEQPGDLEKKETKKQKMDAEKLASNPFDLPGQITIKLLNQGQAGDNPGCEFLSPLNASKFDYLRLDKEFLYSLRCDKINVNSAKVLHVHLKMQLDDTRRPRRQDLFSLYALRREKDDPRMILRLTLENGGFVLQSTTTHPKKKKRYLTQKSLWKSNLVAGSSFSIKLELSEDKTLLSVNEKELPLISTNRTGLMSPSEDLLAILGNRVGGKKPSFGKIYDADLGFTLK